MIKGSLKFSFETDGTSRIEMKCAICESHVGHTFLDEQLEGSHNTSRACANSSAIKYLKPDVLEEEFKNSETGKPKYLHSATVE